jgi:hypothetical protein
MRTDQQLEEALDFVILEVVRFSKMSWEELRTQKDDLLFFVYDAKRHMRIVGRKAMQTIEEVSAEALAASVWKGRMFSGRVAEEIKKAFGSTYLGVGTLPPLTGARYREFLETALEAASQECLDRTYFIPCQITSRSPDNIRFGPVFLERAPVMRARLEERLKTYFDNRSDQNDSQHANDVLDYFDHFSSVASVTVTNCDRDIGQQRSEACVSVVMNYIHLLVGARHTRKMRWGGPAIGRDHRSVLRMLPTGEFETSRSFNFEGANIADEAWEDWNSPELAPIIANIGKCILAIANGMEVGLLGQRFLEACSWYGDAAREPSVPARVVKYITAIERLLCTDERYGVTRRVSERGAALTFNALSWDFWKVVEEMEQAYELRSSVLHGRVSPFSEEITKQAGLCERLSRDLLLSWSERFAEGFQAECTIDALRNYLDGFVEEVKQARPNAGLPSA